MRTKDIEKLLTDFYDGNTTPEQEAELYRYILDEKDDAEYLKSDKQIFLALYESKDDALPSNSKLEAKINNLVDILDAKEKSKARKITWKWIGSIAASVAIIVSLGIYWTSIDNSNEIPLYVDTYSNPEDAYVQTQKVLLLASNKLNKGFDQLETMNNNIEKANGIVHKIIQQ